jgi:hypothetical protein
VRADVSRWFLDNRLLLNPAKTEVVVFGTAQRLRQYTYLGVIDVAGASVHFTEAVKLLGVTLDATLSLDRYVTDVVRVCNFHIRALQHIRSRLTFDVAKSVACSIIGSRLDYCNSLLFNTTESNIIRLQKVQNRLARLVCNEPCTSSATELRRLLHWLPVRQRISYKLAVITYSALHSGQPAYLSALIKPYQPARSLRSSSQNLLLIPSTKIDYERRAFSIAAPQTWNALTLDTKKNVESLAAFKSRLKTELFLAAYD